MENYTYMTLLTTNRYLPGVITLNETLKQVKSKYPLVVLVTTEIDQQILNILDYLKIQWKKVDTIEFNEKVNNIYKKLIIDGKSYWHNCFTKFQIFNQIEFDKIIFFDADIIILKNIDFLFNYNDKLILTENLKLYQQPIEYKNKMININIIGQKNKNKFNSGFMIVKPSKDFFNQIINFINELDEQTLLTLPGDEDYLNLFLIKNNIQLKDMDPLLNIFYSIDYNLPEIMHEYIYKNGYFVHCVGRKFWYFFNDNFTNINIPNINIKNFPPLDFACEILKNVFLNIPIKLKDNLYNIKNYTYMALLTNNTYLQGIILLNETLKKVQTRYPLTVLVTKDVSKATLDILDYLKIKWILIKDINLSLQLKEYANYLNEKNNYILPFNVLTKLNIFYQFQYEKILFLDADIMILKNIDFLFDEFDFCGTYNFQYQQDIENLEFINNKNQSIKLYYPNKERFKMDTINTGFLLFSPQKEQIDILKFIQEELLIEDFKKYNYNTIEDESIFNLYLKKHPKNITILNKYYNTALLPNSSLLIIQDIKDKSYFVHLCGVYKPWDISNKLFYGNYIKGKTQPQINQNSLFYDAIKIIEQVLFSLPPNLMLNFSKAYIKEIQSNKIF